MSAIRSRLGVFVATALLASLSGCREEPAAPTQLTPSPPVLPDVMRVLVFSKTQGFRHESIADAHEFFSNLPAEQRTHVTFSEDAALFDDATLQQFEAVVFANTTGDVLDASQEAALERYIRAGHGFVGIHAAADTEADWPWYIGLVGAKFVNHPETPLEVDVTVEENTHPAVLPFESTFRFDDEWYNFDRNPRQTATILLSIDESGFTVPNTPEGPSMGGDHPVAWYQQYEGGRSFYTNLGHRPETWRDPRFQAHLLAGLEWAARGGSFARTVLTRKARSPIALAVRPDEDVYFIERTGELKLWRKRTGSVETALKLSVDTAHENGMLGLALDPSFAQNSYVYLYYSVPLDETLEVEGPPGRNQLVRYTARADGVIDPNSRLLLLEVPSERRCCHEGGALAFASDGTLLLATGDNTNPFESAGAAPIDERPGRETFNAQRTSQNPFDLRGKILRIRPDGSVPDGNLFDASGQAGRSEIYAMGVRNPYRIAADPKSSAVFFSDLGPDASVDSARGPRGYDEINLAQPGDFGWPRCIAEQMAYTSFDFSTSSVGDPFDCAGTLPAFMAYDYGNLRYPALGPGVLADGGVIGRAAIAGAVYRAGPAAPFAFPARFDGALLIADWTRNTLAAVLLDAGGALKGVERLLPTQGFRRPIDFDVGPDGALYVLEYGSDFWGNNPDAQLSRIEYAELGRLSPQASFTASRRFGPAPLTVHFSAQPSRVGSPWERMLDYAWDFDSNGVIDAHGLEVDYRFAQPGGYSVSLTVTSSNGKRSRPVSEDIVVGNSPPTVRILAPYRNTRLTPGVEVELIGEGVDPEDGPAACEALTWNISLIHNTHAHPVATLQGCRAGFVPEIDQHESDGLLSYAIELSYTDHGGPSGEPAMTDRQGIQFEVAEP